MNYIIFLFLTRIKMLISKINSKVYKNCSILISQIQHEKLDRYTIYIPSLPIKIYHRKILKVC